MIPEWPWVAGAVGAGLVALRLLRLPARRLGYRMAVRTRRQLGYRLNPITLTRKQRLKAELLQDEALGRFIHDHALEQGVPEGDLLARASGFLDEIIPQFNLLTTYRFGRQVASISLRSCYRIRIGRSAERELNAIPRHASVVYVMNHRSNADYVLVAFLLANRVAVSYAVGEWARVWPLETLFRSFGAYFIRRKFRDPLYHRVLERYVQRAVEAGIPQGIFPEGGLSRDGALQPAKLGLLDYMARAGARELVFIPVGINYDRVLEDSNLLREAEGLPRRGLFSLSRRTAFWSLGLAFRTATGRFRRFGYAVANFGPPVRLQDVVGSLDLRSLGWEARKPHLERLGRTLLDAVAREVPLTPVALVAWSWRSLEVGEATVARLRGRTIEVIEWALERGLPVYRARGTAAHVFQLGLDLLSVRGILELRDGQLRADASREALLAYYARSIEHHLGAFQPTTGTASSCAGLPSGAGSEGDRGQRI